MRVAKQRTGRSCRCCSGNKRVTTRLILAGRMEQWVRWDGAAAAECTRRRRNGDIIKYLLSLCLFQTQQEDQNGHRISEHRSIKLLHKIL
jgi:hypothetical protein